MKKLTKITSSLLISTIILSMPNYSQASTSSTVEGTYIVDSKIPSLITLNITDQEDTTGIQAGDQFEITTGKDTKILSISTDKRGSWHQDQIYVKVNGKNKEIINDKVDISEDIQNLFEENNLKAYIKNDSAELYYKDSPLTFEIITPNTVKVTAISKESIKEQIDQIIEKVARESDITDTSSVDKVKESAKAKNIATMYSIKTYMDIDFSKANGPQKIKIDKQDSTVTSQILNLAYVENKDIQLKAKENSDTITITLTAANDTLKNAKKIKLQLPQNFIWDTKEIKNKNLEVKIDKQDQHLLYIQPKIKQKDNNTQSISFETKIKPKDNPSTGYVKANIITENQISQNTLNLFYYQKYKNITIFQADDNYYKKSYEFREDKNILRYIKRKMHTKAYMSHGSLMVPSRQIAQALNLEITYDKNTKITTLKDDKNKIIIYPDKKDIINVNTQDKNIYPQIEIKNSTILLPLPEIAKIFQKENNIIYQKENTQAIIYS